MVSLNWSNRIFDDIDTTADYLANYSKRFAKVFADSIFSKAELVKNFPEMGWIVPEINRPDIRELIYKQYRIVYQVIDSQQILMLTVHHSARPMTEESLFG
jgi:toxin ParE1/3/4